MPIDDVAALVSVILGTTSILAIVGKFFILGPLTRLIDDRTQPVQPHANGGLALPDVARTVERIEAKLDRHIEWHMGDAK